MNAGFEPASRSDSFQLHLPAFTTSFKIPSSNTTHNPNICLLQLTLPLNTSSVSLSADPSDRLTDEPFHPWCLSVCHLNSSAESNEYRDHHRTPWNDKKKSARDICQSCTKVLSPEAEDGGD